ncbi:molybdate ABC transporter permease subunit [Yunchengibacter salinarum]|uniref:molybdate ABC transporter permease subunit n=1 Tax=Yunchengibacter salinarum TaxID=3133399 RepID=UPI0035B62A44
MTDAAISAIVWLSLKVAFTVVALGLPLALALAYLLARRDFPGKLALDTLLHAPLVVPPVVVGYGLLLLFSPAAPLGGWLEAHGLGLAYRWQGAALAALVMALPLMVRAIRQAFEAEDPALGQSLATLGVPPRRRFFMLSLPLALPGIATGAALGFARALGEFGATITFVANIPGQTQTLPLAIYTAAQSPGGETTAMHLALISLVPALASLGLSEWISRRARRRRGLLGAAR